MARKRRKNNIDIRKIILMVLTVLCLYFILALFGSSLSGDAGQAWGVYLRGAWGGAVIVPLLFWLYLCVAKFLGFRVPYLPRQILGTLQLYISFAFMLGLLRETGWNSEATLFLPGRFGSGLAHFFVLNVGMFITFLLVMASFVLSAFLFGLRILRASFPNSSPTKSENKNETPRRRRRKNSESAQSQYPEDRPENILFMKDLPAPHLKDYDESAQISMTRPAFEDFARPNLKPDPEPEVDEEFYDEEEFLPESGFEDEKVNEKFEDLREKENYAIEIIDNLLASINSGAMSMPEKKRQKSPERDGERTRKIRRPLPAVVFDGEFDGSISDTNSGTDIQTALRGFPPPLDIFGAAASFEPPRENVKTAEKT
ncbi:MAG: hypothetical protein IJU31_03160, partial [Synergistaceae bacterium]|nr:hypothetical protein [Synergistaceae bacterium]